MADRLTTELDFTGVVRAFERLGGEVTAKHLGAAARETASRIATEASARLRRQTHGTGETAGAIVFELGEHAMGARAGPIGAGLRQSTTGYGYLVFVAPTSRPAELPVWLEFGTKHMLARPFLVAAARLEDGPHRRRVEQALASAIAEVSR